MPNVIARTWEYWTLRLQAAGALPPRRSAKQAARRGKTKAKSKAGRR
jgi:hypothetical protein